MLERILEPEVISGHPQIELDTGASTPTLLTVCAHCGELRTILFLRHDRWLCTRCRMTGIAPPRLYPVK
jgi:ribosomal protein S27AE